MQFSGSSSHLGKLRAERNARHPKDVRGVFLTRLSCVFCLASSHHWKVWGECAAFPTFNFDAEFAQISHRLFVNKAQSFYGFIKLSIFYIFYLILYYFYILYLISYIIFMSFISFNLYYFYILLYIIFISFISLSYIIFLSYILS